MRMLHTLRIQFHVFHKYGKQHFTSTLDEPRCKGAVEMPRALCMGEQQAPGQGVCTQNNMETAANVFPLNSLDTRRNQIFSLGTLMKH